MFWFHTPALHANALQGYEGSLLKVTSKNGKTASPVGFVTFNSRAGADAAKQDLQVRKNTPPATWSLFHRSAKMPLDRQRPVQYVRPQATHGNKQGASCKSCRRTKNSLAAQIVALTCRSGQTNQNKQLFAPFSPQLASLGQLLEREKEVSQLHVSLATLSQP